MNVADIINKTRYMKKLAAVWLLLVLALPLFAREVPDSTFTFRFYLGRDEFYSPGMNNGEELANMYECVERYKDLIKAKEIVVYVDGYYATAKSKAENLRIARTRSNRVKSELITRKGLKEDNFSTRNHSGEGNFVTVRFGVPLNLIRPEEPKPVEPEPMPPAPEPAVEPEPVIEPESVVEPEVVEIVETVETPEVVAPAEEVLPAEPAERKERGDSKFALKTNLLYYAVLMPNVELEWAFAPGWSAALEVQGAWYGKEVPHKIYKIATLMPEVRYWIKQQKRWRGGYVGIFGGAGLYDLDRGKKDVRGHEGEGGMIGVSGGYMWPISKRLSLDASLGVGYLRFKDKSYLPFDGHYLHQMTKHINYFGPLRLKLSLVWRIPE